MSQDPDSGELLEAYLATLEPSSQASSALRRHPNFSAIIDTMLETRGIRAEVAMELLLVDPNPVGLAHVYGLVTNALEGTGRAGVSLALRILRDLPPAELSQKMSDLVPRLLKEFKAYGEDEEFVLRDLLGLMLEFGLPDDVTAVAERLDAKDQLEDEDLILLSDPTHHSAWRDRGRDSFPQ